MFSRGRGPHNRKMPGLKLTNLDISDSRAQILLFMRFERCYGGALGAPWGASFWKKRGGAVMFTIGGYITYPPYKTSLILCFCCHFSAHISARMGISRKGTGRLAAFFYLRLKIANLERYPPARGEIPRRENGQYALKIGILGRNPPTPIGRLTFSGA